MISGGGGRADQTGSFQRLGPLRFQVQDGGLVSVCQTIGSQGHGLGTTGQVEDQVVCWYLIDQETVEGFLDAGDPICVHRASSALASQCQEPVEVLGHTPGELCMHKHGHVGLQVPGWQQVGRWLLAN